MANGKMPLILDNSMSMELNDVDGLFGDAVSNLTLPSRSQNKQLQQRLVELRRRGCCQAVAWSKTGTIASLTADRLSLELRFLRCNPKTGSWDLSEPTACNLVQGTPAIPLVHLEWSWTNTPELAVIDAVGRVAIVGCSLALNNLYVTRKWDTDSIDDLHAIVGCHYLAAAPTNQQKPYNVMYGPATRTGNAWQYESSFVHAGGPSHPHTSKSALFCVTVSGVLKMFWSQGHGRQEETSVELDTITSSEDVVTHASIASDKKFLIVALAKASGHLRLMKVEINWNITPVGGDRPPNAQNATLNPTLTDKHLAATYWNQNASVDPNLEGFKTTMSQLQVLPSLMDNTGKNTAPPVIVVVRACTPSPASYQTAQTILDRWEAIEQRQPLHEAFVELGSRRNKSASELPLVTSLKRLDPIVINKVVIGLQSIYFGKVLMLAFSDGTVEYRDRFTFEELYTAEDTSKVMNLRQVGWSFTDNGACHQTAFSPTFCSMIQMSDDGKIRWSKLHFPAGEIGESMQSPHYAASIAGLAITAASCIWYQGNYDDLLAIVQPFSAAKRFVQDWISELIRILKVQVDFSEELHHDALMRNTPLQSCLSIMNSLGFRGETNARSFHSKFALVDLNVRNVVVLITLASNTPVPVREKMSPLDEPEVVEALNGCVEWSMGLLSWLADSLFALMNDQGFIARMNKERFAEVGPYLRENNDVCLHLLFCSASRSFLSALCRRIAHLQSLSSRAVDFYRRHAAAAEPGSRVPNLQLQQAYQRMQNLIKSSLVKANDFDNLLNTLGADIRQTYQAFLPTMIRKQPNAPQGKQIDVAVKTTQNQLELSMLLGTSPPPALLAVITKFLMKDVAALRELTDPASLFFADFSLLEVQDDKNSLAERAAKSLHVDVFRRKELQMTPSQQWRRCARCTAVMEDLFGTRPGFTFVLGTQRKCSCGGHWGLLPKGVLSM